MNAVVTTSGGSPFDALKHGDSRGEFWLARELMAPLGYEQWRRFADAIERAKVALAANEERPDEHIEFLPAPAKTSGGRPGVDYRLTRYGVYATIQGADPRKPEIAAAWGYFRVRTRQAETGAGGLHFDPDLQRIVELTIGMQQTRDEVKAIERQQKRIVGELAAMAEDVADLKAVSPLHGGDLLSLRDAARAVTGTRAGQNVFKKWLLATGVMFTDHAGHDRVYQTPWVAKGWAIERWERWPNGHGESWVPYFTATGVAKLRQAYTATETGARS